MCEVLEYEDPDDLEPVDVDKTAHDKQAVTTTQTQAVSIAKVKFNMELDANEAQTVVGLPPKFLGHAPENFSLTHIWNRL